MHRIAIEILYLAAEILFQRPPRTEHRISYDFVAYTETLP